MCALATKEGGTEWVKKTSIDPRDDLTLAKKVFKIFCSGLRFSLDEEDIRRLFERFGKVVSVIIPIRRSGGKPGYAIIYMAYEQDGIAAIRHLDGSNFQDFRLSVSEWKPTNERSQRRDDYNEPQRAPDFYDRDPYKNRPRYDDRPRRQYDDREPRESYDGGYRNEMSRSNPYN